ncbi:MAG: DUF429 domain-containing protein [Geminicoccaceae bacterium]|nr:DUF429 domain-containing protein [Geminicoccaceae bacterium]
MNAKPILLHADWSSSPSGRALAIAVPGAGRWRVDHLFSPVSDAWLLRLLAGLPKPVLFGMDLPLGVPEAYARRLGLGSFRELLERLDGPDFADFGRPATTPTEISLHRPFYPAAAGGTRQAHLVEGLGLKGPRELRRRCERATALHLAAAPLFWTMGPQQVGKAALAAWYGVIRPALRDMDATLWPFDGDFDDLLSQGGPVFAETYPSIVRRRLAPRHGDLPLHMAHNRQRIAAEAWARFTTLDLAPQIVAEAEAGFATPDLFDGFMGLLGMIRLVEDGWEPPPPPSPWIGIEGWMLGLAASELREPVN